MNDFIDYYQLLGIDFGATDDVVDRAYRAKIKLVHPDRNGGANDAVEHTKRLNEARDVLKDPVKRVAYRTRWLAHHAKARLRNKKRAVPHPRSHAPQRGNSEHGWRQPPPPMAWTPAPPPPPVPSVAPVGGGGWGELLALFALLGGAYVLSKKNGYDRRAGRHRGPDGTFRSGPFS
jgi:curved DNA-binding protein CbpA